MLQRGAAGLTLLASVGCLSNDFEPIKNEHDAGSGDGRRPPDAGASANLIENSGMETSHAGWLAFGSAQLVHRVDEGRDDSNCLACVDRTDSWAGPAYRIEPLVTAGHRYRIEGWVRVGDSTQTELVRLSLKTTCPDGANTYESLAAVLASSTEWTPISAELIAPVCGPSELMLYFEGPAPGVTLYLDDVGLYGAGSAPAR